MALGTQAGAAFIELVPKLSPDFESRLNQQGERLGKGLAAKFESAGKRFRDVGKKFSIAATLPIAAVGVAAFKAASDLNEAENKAAVVFGRQSGVIEKFAAGAAKNLGISRTEALNATGTFGNLFRAMGIGVGSSAAMSQSLVVLASDLASFNNANPEDVLVALKSGLVGETEPLRQFGVNLNEARIQAEALRLGLVKAPVDLNKVAQANLRVSAAQNVYTKAVKDHGAGSEEARSANDKLTIANNALNKALGGGVPKLDAAAKAQAAYSLILNDTKLAQGDFARTSTGAANAQRIATAQFKDAAATLGKNLLPIGQRLIAFASQLAQRFNALSPTGQKVVLVAVALVAAIGPLATIIGGLLTIVPAVAGALGAIAGALGISAIAALPVIALFAAIAIGLVLLYKRSAQFRKIVAAAFRAVMQVAQGLADVFRGVFDIIVGLFSGDWARLWDGVKRTLRGALNVILGLFKLQWGTLLRIIQALGPAIIRFLLSLPGKAVSALAGLGRALIAAGAAMVAGMLTGLRAGFERVVGFIRTWGPRILVIVAFWPAILVGIGVAVLVGLLSGLRSKFPAILAFFAALPGRVLVFFANAAVWLLAKGVELISGLLLGAIARAPAFFAWLLTLPGRILIAVGNLLAQLVPKGLEIIGGLITGAVSALPRLLAWVMGIPGSIVGAIGDIAARLFSIGLDVVRGLLEGIKAAWHTVTDFIGGAAKGITHGIKSVLGIGSPSKVFMGIGADTIAGLVLGLRSGLPDVDRAMLDAGNRLTMRGRANATMGLDLGRRSRLTDATTSPNGQDRRAELHVEQNLFSLDSRKLAHDAATELALARRSRPY